MVARRKEEIVWLKNESVPMIRVKEGQTGCSVIPTGNMLSAYMHWVPDLHRTMPCVLGKCPHCPAGSPRRPLSYLGCMHWRLYDAKGQWLPAIVELPWRCAQTVERMVGERVCLRRDRRFGPVNVGKYLFADTLPSLIKVDVIPHMFALWRLPEGAQVALIGNAGPAAD